MITRITFLIFLLQCGLLAQDTKEFVSPDGKKKIAAKDGSYYCINRTNGAILKKIVDEDDVTELCASWNPASDRVIVVLFHRHWSELAIYKVEGGEVVKYEYEEPSDSALMGKDVLKEYPSRNYFYANFKVVGWPTPKSAKIQFQSGFRVWNVRLDGWGQGYDFETIFNVEFSKNSVKSHLTPGKIIKWDDQSDNDTKEFVSPDGEGKVALRDGSYYFINKANGAVLGKIVDADDVTDFDASWNPTSDRAIVLLGHRRWQELAIYKVERGKVTRYEYQKPDGSLFLGKDREREHPNHRKMCEGLRVVDWPTPRLAKIQLEIGIVDWNEQNDLYDLETIYYIEFAKDSLKSHVTRGKIIKNR